jgi:intracellular multiplication protein IcmS
LYLCVGSVPLLQGIEKLHSRGGKDKGNKMDMSELISKVARTMGARFSLNGCPMTMEEVFSPTGLLPAIARRADQLCSLCLGYGIGVTFEETEGAKQGVKVIFDDITPNVLRMLCIADVLHELVQPTARGDMTSLDQLMYD